MRQKIATPITVKDICAESNGFSSRKLTCVTILLLRNPMQVNVARTNAYILIGLTLIISAKPTDAIKIRASRCRFPSEIT